MRRLLVLGLVVLMAGCPLLKDQGGSSEASRSQAPPPRPQPKDQDPVVEGKRLSDWATALRSSDPKARREAAKVLSHAGQANDAAITALTDALADKDGDVRMYAAEALGKAGMDAKPAVPALLEAAKDEDKYVRQAAIDALKSIDPEAAAKAGMQ